MPDSTIDAADIGLIGLWHLGTVAAAAWTATDRSVVTWDPDHELREALRSGHGGVVEPGVDDALQSAIQRGLLTIVDDVTQAVAATSVTHLAYDTAVSAEGRPEDPRLDAAVSAFSRAAPDGALLLVSSQLAVGTCRRWARQLGEQERDLVLAHAPENLRLGRALEDFMHPARLVIGADEPAARRRSTELLAPFSSEPIEMGLTSAEMTKHATNAYLALCVAFGNDLAWLSLSAGADPSEVTEGLRADPRVSRTAPVRPGTAFSGATLTRDLVTLRDLGESCGRPDLFEAVIRANERHAKVAFTWLEESLGSLAGTRIAIAGLTYKPGTSTLRDSLPLRLVSQLLDRGVEVAAWDPAAEAFEPPQGFTRAASLEGCVRNADALAVMTALPEIANLDWTILEPARRIVVDGCMAVDRARAEAAGWAYVGLATG